MLKACFWSWKAYVLCLTCSDVSQHLFQFSDGDVDSGLGFLLYNFVCFFSFDFVVQFVVVVANVPTTFLPCTRNWLSNQFLTFFFLCHLVSRWRGVFLLFRFFISFLHGWIVLLLLMLEQDVSDLIPVQKWIFYCYDSYNHLENLKYVRCYWSREIYFEDCSIFRFVFFNFLLLLYCAYWFLWSIFVSVAFRISRSVKSMV